MNIFFLDSNPQKAAQYHCDKHVVKMILETAQILASCHNLSLGIDSKKKYLEKSHFLSGYFFDFPRRKLNNEPDYYGLGYVHHGCVRWAFSRLNNYNWLCELGKHLCHEYYLRYGKTKNKRHKTERIIDYFSQFKPDIPEFDDISFPYLAVGESFPVVSIGHNSLRSAVETYRLYYVIVKKDICSWKSGAPGWFLEVYKKIEGQGWSAV